MTNHGVMDVSGNLQLWEISFGLTIRLHLACAIMICVVTGDY